MGDKLLFYGGQMFRGGGEVCVWSVGVRFGSVLFQYNGLETSVYCHYVISILEYVRRV